MKKILHVVNISFVIPSFFGNQFRYFKERGFTSHVICSPSPDLEVLSKSLEFNFYEVAINRSFSLREDIGSIKKICKYIKTRNIDIVVGHTPKGALLAMLASFFCGVKKRIFFRHGLVYETTNGLKREVLKNIERLTSFFSTQVICVSPYLVEKSVNDRLTRSNKLFLLNKGSCAGVDADFKFNPKLLNLKQRSLLQSQYGILKKSFVIGFVGRISKDKGVEELIKAFSILQKRNNLSIKLLLVGPMDERIGISSQTLREINTNPDIIVTGLIKDKKEYFYSLMDIFVFPTYREGFGNVILEASSMELPILTTSHSGSRDAIIEDTTGRFISLKPKDIADEIQNYIINKELGLMQGENGRNFVLKNFTNDIIWKEIEKLYQ